MKLVRRWWIHLLSSLFKLFNNWVLCIVFLFSNCQLIDWRLAFVTMDLFKVHAKQGSSIRFVFRCFIHHSIENLTASKNMCSLNFFETLPFEKSKNLEWSKKVNFPLILYKVEFSKFHANLDHSNCHILVQHQKLNQKMIWNSFQT